MTAKLLSAKIHHVTFCLDIVVHVFIPLWLFWFCVEVLECQYILPTTSCCPADQKGAIWVSSVCQKVLSLCSGHATKEPWFFLILHPFHCGLRRKVVLGSIAFFVS